MNTIEHHTSLQLDYLENALAPWQTSIMQGNSAFEQGKLLPARDSYFIAKNLAAHLLQQFLHSPLNDDVTRAIEHCIPALVVASHNLADTYIALQQVEKACHCLCEIHNTVLSLMQNEHFYVRQISQYHNVKTSSELMLFAKRYAVLPEIIDKINNCLGAQSTPSGLLH
ncbi:hypothetical protein J8L70_10885 [Pseudoalteromonas sp. MMG010]|nr:hypothetical protein [Pseudoalteromonas sp. MMG010]